MLPKEYHDVANKEDHKQREATETAKPSHTHTECRRAEAYSSWKASNTTIKASPSLENTQNPQHQGDDSIEHQVDNSKDGLKDDTDWSPPRTALIPNITMEPPQTPRDPFEGIAALHIHPREGTSVDHAWSPLEHACGDPPTIETSARTVFIEDPVDNVRPALDANTPDPARLKSQLLDVSAMEPDG